MSKIDNDKYMLVSAKQLSYTIPAEKMVDCWSGLLRGMDEMTLYSEEQIYQIAVNANRKGLSRWARVAVDKSQKNHLHVFTNPHPIFDLVFKKVIEIDYDQQKRNYANT